MAKRVLTSAASQIGVERVLKSRKSLSSDTTDEARRRIIEPMELFIDNARSAKIVDDVGLPAVAKKSIRASTSLRRRASRKIDAPQWPPGEG